MADVPVNKQILYSNCLFSTEKLPDGGRQLQVLDPLTGTLHLFPLPPEVSRQIGNDLFSAVPIATEVPRG